MGYTVKMLTDFWSVLALASIPFTELRLALPLAITVYGMSPASAYGSAVIGNIIPVIVILTVLPVCVDFLRRKFPFLDSFFTWWFSRVSRMYEKKIHKWGSLALFIFVAIPFPMTGAWTGSLAAYIFKIPRWKAFIYIIGGVMIAGVLVLLGTLGIINIFV